MSHRIPDSIDIPDDGSGGFLARRPWILVILLFIVLTIGLTGVVLISRYTFPGHVELAPRDGAPAPSETAPPPE